MTAVLCRIFGLYNSGIIEDIVQETFIAALKTWPVKGVPENAPAWLMQVAKNKTLNVIKKRKKLSQWSQNMQVGEEHIERLFLDGEIRDSQLRVLVACCYPEIPVKVQIMLTLKIIGGFHNKEIAGALLMTEAAVKKAIYRAKKEVQVLHDGSTIPGTREAINRVDTIYRVIYLMFNEGYKSNYKDTPVDEDLCFEAIRLAHLLLKIEELNHGECHALLSLMYFGMARFPARTREGILLVDLKEQNRQHWNQQYIQAGFHHLRKSRVSTRLSKYHLESTIASLHCSAASFDETDWETIVGCYEKLLHIEGTPLIRINYAIALGKAKSPQEGILVLDKIDTRLSKNELSLLHAARGELQADMGHYAAARSYYQVACDMAVSEADKAFLREKMEECNRKDISPN